MFLRMRSGLHTRRVMLLDRCGFGPAGVSTVAHNSVLGLDDVRAVVMGVECKPDGADLRLGGIGDLAMHRVPVLGRQVAAEDAVHVGRNMVDIEHVRIVVDVAGRVLHLGAGDVRQGVSLALVVGVEEQLDGFVAEGQRAKRKMFLIRRMRRVRQLVLVRSSDAPGAIWDVVHCDKPVTDIAVRPLELCCVCVLTGIVERQRIYSCKCIQCPLQLVTGTYRQTAVPAAGGEGRLVTSPCIW